MASCFSSRSLPAWHGLIAVGLACAIPTWTLAQARPADKAVAGVLADWKFRQGIMKSVRYVLKGSTEFRDEPLPPGDPIQPRRGILLLDLVKHRYCYEYSEGVKNAMGHSDDEPQKWRYTQRSHTTAYDGKRWQAFTNRKANGIEDDVSDLSIAKGKMPQGSAFDSLLNPIFFAHGFVGTVHKPIVRDDWPLSQDPDDFRNQGQQLFEGMNCLVLRIDPLSIGGPRQKSGGLYDEFWINTQQKSAIQRYFNFNGANPGVQLEITWKDTPQGWWVDEWSNTWSSNNQVQRISRYQIESMEVDPEVSDADFTLKAEPGMKVTVGEYSVQKTAGWDPTKGSIKTYRISRTGAWIELSPEGVPVRNGGVWIGWIGGIGAIAGCGILALLFYVIRRRLKIATN